MYKYGHTAYAKLHPKNSVVQLKIACDKIKDQIDTGRIDLAVHNIAVLKFFFDDLDGFDHTKNLIAYCLEELILSPDDADQILPNISLISQALQELYRQNTY